MLHLFLSAIGLGLAYCATPGAVNTEALRRGLTRGFRPALLIEFGSLVGDMAWATIALTGTAVVVRHRSLTLVLGIVGACFLLRLAISALRGAPLESDAGNERASAGHFATGAAFSLTNPFALAFWLGMGAGVAATASGGTGASTAAFLGGFFVGAVLWCLLFASAVTWGRRILGPRFFRMVDTLCGLTLGFFGLRLLWRSLSALRLLRVFVG